MNIMIVRRPIFDSADRLTGYEILAHDPEGADDARALVDAVFGDGGRRIADDNLAFVTPSRDMLVSGAMQALDPAAVVLQIARDLHADHHVHRACENLVATGYALALDRFTFADAATPLLELASIVKYDVQHVDDAFLAAQMALLEPYRVQALAENVSNRAEHEACTRLGFSLFQGILFARPENVTRSDLSTEHVRTFKVMNLVRDLDVTEQRLQQEFRVDPGLSYKLLRMVNAAAAGGRGVQSIEHALRLLGRDSLYRWLSLLLVKPARFGEVDGAIVLASLSRARFCELLAPHGERPLAAGSLFMVGLLSALIEFGGIPAAQIASELELAPEIAAALNGRSGPLGAALALVEAYERGDWQALDGRCSDLGVDPIGTGDIYLEALTWAQAHAVRTASADAA